MAKKGSRVEKLEDVSQEPSVAAIADLTASEKFYIENHTDASVDDLSTALGRDPIEFTNYLDLCRHKKTITQSLLSRNQKSGFVAMTMEASSLEKPKAKAADSGHKGHIHRIKKS